MNYVVKNPRVQIHLWDMVLFPLDIYIYPEVALLGRIALSFKEKKLTELTKGHVEVVLGGC